jgi:hypothetical protein
MFSSAAVVGDPGDSAGSFALNVPGLTGGSLSLDANSGIVQWTPSTNCPAATYSATATYTYDGGQQIRAFPITTTTADMPPAFVIDSSGVHEPLWHYHDAFFPMSPSGHLQASLVAYDSAGPITGYELSGDLPPGATFDTTTGLFDWSCCPADQGYVDYAFQVKATNASGQFDILHAVAKVISGLTQFTLDYPRSCLTETPWLVAPNSGENLVAGLCPTLAMSELDGVLTIGADGNSLTYDVNNPGATLDTGNGTVAFATGYSSLGCILYTPNPGFRGLDVFSYYWEYDGYDINGNPIRCEANTSIAQIQVGNWVDLLPATTYNNDIHQSIMAVGDRETTTLTLQNPRGDGVVSVGYWCLDFDRSKIRVYGPNGQEILPHSDGGFGQGPSGSEFIEAVAGEKNVTLTVVGVSGSIADLTAEWHIWACPYDPNVFGNDGPHAGWYWYTTAVAHITVVGVDIVDLGRGGKLITGLTSTIVVGQVNYLSGDVEPYGLEITSNQWTVPGDDGTLIYDYTQSSEEGKVYPLSPGYLQSQDVQFYWVAGGTNLLVTYAATIDGHVYSAKTTFNVLRPTATLPSTTTPDLPPVAVGPDPRAPISGVSLHFGLAQWPSDGIIWNATVSTGSGEQGQIAFTQLVRTDTLYTADNPNGDMSEVSSNGAYVLDGGPPQYSEPADINSNTANFHYSSNDSPFVGLPSWDKHVSRRDDFQLYLMYKSDEAGSVWVTLCELDWYWCGAATKAGGAWSLDGDTGDSSINPVGVDSIKLPQWEGCVQGLKLIDL